jgi:hypothetical protein
MDLNEFRNKMSSDATEENKRLKAELSKLKKQYREKVDSLEEENANLKEDCRALSNRCWVFMGGVLCANCFFHSSFVCKHAPTLEEMVKMGAALRREMEGK